LPVREPDGPVRKLWPVRDPYSQIVNRMGQYATLLENLKPVDKIHLQMVNSAGMLLMG
jgi:hypothetical protein